MTDRVNVAVIEWDSSEDPSVFVGATMAVVIRAVWQRLYPMAYEGVFNEVDDVKAFLDSTRKPEPTDEVHQMGDWLDGFKDATTVPYVTFYANVQVLT